MPHAARPHGLRAPARRRSDVALAWLVLSLWAVPAGAQAIKVGSFTKVTGAGQTVAHGLGVTPKALILWTDGRTDETFGTSFLYAFGMTDGPMSSWSTATASRTNAATPAAARRLAKKAITIMDWTQSVTAEADLQSWDATNFALMWTTNATLSAYVIHYIAIGGPAVSAKLVNWGNALGVQKKASFVSMDANGFTVDFTNATSALAGQVVSLALKGVAAKAGSFLKSTTASAPAFVAGQHAYGSGGSSATGGSATLPAASTTGNLIAVGIDFGGNNRTVTSVTHNKGNTYRLAVGQTVWSGGSGHASTYYASNITGGAGAITVTVTLSGTCGSWFQM